MKQKGFTLIELMITIAVLGILLSIAVPAYQDYLVKARVTEGLNLATAAKLAVSETAMTTRSLAANQEMTSYTSPAPTANVQSIVIGANGVITINYTERAGNGNILLVPIMGATGELTWTCNTGTLPDKYRPAPCKKTLKGS